MGKVGIFTNWEIDSGDRALGQVMDSMNQDWLNTSNDTWLIDKKSILTDIAYQMKDYILEKGKEHGVYLGEPGTRIDIKYWIGEYLSDVNFDIRDGNYDEDTPLEYFLQEVFDEKETQDEKDSDFLMSEEYTMMKYADADYLAFECNFCNADETIKGCFENDNTHGFISKEDMKATVMALKEDKVDLDFDCYESGSYGYHSVDGTEECGFEVWGTFLGNTEETEECESVLPLDLSSIVVDGKSLTEEFTYQEYVYATNTHYIRFCIPWKVLEEKGKELGYIR